ncbi:hypothetical protein N431DRAFT_239157 [Stipitochalara longipes BDJ]|nr:hypothetical protein N431DRAFT_239157 [Stipitochalara longipes BDJ]
MQSRTKKHLVSISVCHLICISTQKAGHQLSSAQLSQAQAHYQREYDTASYLLYPLLSLISEPHTHTHTKEEREEEEKPCHHHKFPARPLIFPSDAAVTVLPYSVLSSVFDPVRDVVPNFYSFHPFHPIASQFRQIHHESK